MLDLCNELESGFGCIDYGLLNHSENPDDEFLGDLEPASALVGKSIGRGRKKISVKDFPEVNAGSDGEGDDEDGEDGDSDEPLDTVTGTGNEDPFVSDLELVVVNDAAAESFSDGEDGEGGEPLDTDSGEDYPDYTKSMILADDPNDLAQAEPRARLPISCSVRYKRSVLRNT